MQPVSLDIPIDSAVTQYGALEISSFLVTDEFTIEHVPEDRIELADFEAAFSIGGERPETPLPKYSDDGPGAAAPVCPSMQIGRAACRERVGQYVLILGVAGTLKKKKLNKQDNQERKT